MDEPKVIEFSKEPANTGPFTINGVPMYRTAYGWSSVAKEGIIETTEIKNPEVRSTS